MQTEPEFASELPKEYIPLCELPCGEPAWICALKGDSGWCSRLREIGFCEANLIERVGGTHNLVCRLHQGQVVLSAQAARQIWVYRLAS